MCHLTDFLSRPGCPFREFSYFIGDDREASSGISRTCSLNGCIESKQVGLVGNVLDYTCDTADFFRTLPQGFDLFRRLANSAGQ